MKDIFIVSRKRADTPITWNAFPDKYKERTKFVVWEDDAQDYISAFGKENVEVISLSRTDKKDIHLGTKRNHIYYKFMHPHIVFDDDIEITKRSFNLPEKRPPTFVNEPMEEEDYDCFFDDMFNIPTKQPGYNWGGVLFNTVVPTLKDDKKFSEFIFGRVAAVFYFNRPVLPNNIDFAKFPLAEDMYLNIELNLQGFPSGVYQKYTLNIISPFNENGGCSVYRTIDYERRVNEDLKKTYPKYVKLKNIVQNKGIEKGKNRCVVVLYRKKAYNDYLKRNKPNKLIIS